MTAQDVFCQVIAELSGDTIDQVKRQFADVELAAGLPETDTGEELTADQIRRCREQFRTAEHLQSYRDSKEVIAEWRAAGAIPGTVQATQTLVFDDGENILEKPE
jgi:hypothetical protein